MNSPVIGETPASNFSGYRRVTSILLLDAYPLGFVTRERATPSDH